MCIIYKSCFSLDDYYEPKKQSPHLLFNLWFSICLKFYLYIIAKFCIWFYLSPYVYPFVTLYHTLLFLSGFIMHFNMLIRYLLVYLFTFFSVFLFIYFSIWNVAYTCSVKNQLLILGSHKVWENWYLYKWVFLF